MKIAAGIPAHHDVALLDPAEPLPRIEAVLFDFANTLFRPVDTATWLREGLAALGVETDPARIVEFERALDAAWESPEVVAAQAGRDLSREAHRAAGETWIGAVPELRPYAAGLYDRVTSVESWLPYRDTVRVLRSLGARGIPIGIVSDIAWDLRPQFVYEGLDDVVGAYALSFEYGVEKPHPKLFLSACDQLGVDPRGTLMVGDNPTRDGGATACGLRAYVLPAEPRTGDRGLGAALRLLG
jgi:FMN phosphatase YigB (HAD superfamily)